MGNRIITEEFLREELSKEQFQAFLKAKEEAGLQNALAQLPLFESSNKVVSMVNSNIKQLRLENGLSQQDLANILNVSQKEYWRYEQQGYSVNILILAQIAIFYNVSLDWISGYHKERKPFFADAECNSVNGYTLQGMKEAKAKKEKYTPVIFKE